MSFDLINVEQLAHLKQLIVRLLKWQVQVDEMLDKVTKFIEDHILVAVEEFFVLIFFCLKYSFEETASLFEKLLWVLFNVSLFARHDSVLFIV